MYNGIDLLVNIECVRIVWS